MDAFFQQAQPSRANSETKSNSSNHIKVDRSFNPFTSDHPTTRETVNLTEMYHTEIPSAEPSKINLFDDADDLEEDLFRLPNGYWLFNKEGKTLMLDLGRMHRVILQSRQEPIKTNKNSQHLLFSLEYHLNEIEKNKYKSIKKFLPNLGFEMVIAQENVLRINAVPEGLKESAVIKFLEKVFEILEYRTEDEFMTFYQEQWLKVQSKSKFDFLYKSEVEELVLSFTEIGFPQYTATGKKCYIEVPFDDFKTKF